MAKRTASQASEGVVKEFPITEIADFDLDLFQVKERGLNKEGLPTFVTSYNQQRLTLNLTSGKKWLQVKWRIQASMYDKEDPSKLKVSLAVDEEAAATIQKIEDAVKAAVLPKLKATLSPKNDASDHYWHSSLKEGVFTPKVVLDAKNASSLTHFKVRPFHKDVIDVAGKDQLQPLLNENAGFMGAKARAVVSLDSVWVLHADGAKGVHPATAGIFWKVNRFMVDLPEQVRWVVPDVFANASWDDDEE